MQVSGNGYTIENRPTLSQVAVVLIGGLVIFSIVPVGVAAQQETSTAEPNDNREDAVRLDFEDTSIEGISEASVSGYNETEDSPARFGPGDREDWYAFDLEAGQAVRAWGTGGVVASISGSFVGPDGTVLGNLSLGGENTGNGAVAEESGTYYIHMKNDSITGPIAYSLTVQVAESSRFEPNDDRDTATPFTPGDRLRSTITDGDKDWFAVNISKSERLNATLQLNNLIDGPVLVGGVTIDIFAFNGTRIGKLVPPDRSFSEPVPGNGTDRYAGKTKVTWIDEADAERTYYIRIKGPTYGGSFTPYSLAISTEERESPSQTRLNASSFSNITITKNETGIPNGNVEYQFSVSGEVEQNSKSEPGEVVDNDTARGSIGPARGTDTFRFSGELTDFSLEGPANVYVNGEQISPNDLPVSTLPPTPSTTSTSVETTTRSPTSPTETQRTTTLARSTPTEVANSGSDTRISSSKTEHRPSDMSEEGQPAATAARDSDESNSQGPGFGFLITILAISLLVLLGMRSQVK